MWKRVRKLLDIFWERILEDEINFYLLSAIILTILVFLGVQSLKHYEQGSSYSYEYENGPHDSLYIVDDIYMLLGDRVNFVSSDNGIYSSITRIDDGKNPGLLDIFPAKYFKIQPFVVEGIPQCLIEDGKYLVDLQKAVQRDELMYSEFFHRSCYIQAKKIKKEGDPRELMSSASWMEHLYYLKIAPEGKLNLGVQSLLNTRDVDYDNKERGPISLPPD